MSSKSRSSKSNLDKKHSTKNDGSDLDLDYEPTSDIESEEGSDDDEEEEESNVAQEEASTAETAAAVDMNDDDNGDDDDVMKSEPDAAEDSNMNIKEVLYIITSISMCYLDLNPCAVFTFAVVRNVRISPFI
jgi:hypothetical protein